MDWKMIKDYIPAGEREVLLCGYNEFTNRYHYCVGKLGPKNNKPSISVNVDEYNVFLGYDITHIEVNMTFWCELEAPR